MKMSKPPRWAEVLELPLAGERTSVRRFEASDITLQYLSWLNNPRVTHFSNQRFQSHTIESCLKYLRGFTDSPNYFLAIWHSAEQSMIGTLTVYHNTHHRTADIGILIGNPNLWGQGLGLEAFTTLSRALYHSGHLRKLTSGCLAENRGMVSILEKAGFKLEATRVAQELLDDLPSDIVYYSKHYVD